VQPGLATATAEVHGHRRAAWQGIRRFAALRWRLHRRCTSLTVRRARYGANRGQARACPDEHAAHRTHVPTRSKSLRFQGIAKLHGRLLQPLTAANTAPAPLPLRQALRVIDTYIDDYIGQSRLVAW